jgi:RecJ-like exonuclease
MKTKTCPDCNGDGVVDKGTDDEHQCPTCGGRGFVPDDDDNEDVIKASPINHPWSLHFSDPIAIASSIIEPIELSAT